MGRGKQFLENTQPIGTTAVAEGTERNGKLKARFDMFEGNEVTRGEKK